LWLLAQAASGCLSALLLAGCLCQPKQRVLRDSTHNYNCCNAELWKFPQVGQNGHLRHFRCRTSVAIPILANLRLPQVEKKKRINMLVAFGRVWSNRLAVAVGKKMKILVRPKFGRDLVARSGSLKPLRRRAPKIR